MSERRFVDAVVIGAGPAGSAFAHVFAGAKRRVLVVERGEPSTRAVCGGFLGAEIFDSICLARLNEVFRGIPKKSIRRVCVSSPVNPLMVSELAWPAFAVDRTVFNQHLIEAARHVGAQFFWNTVLLEARRQTGLWNLTLAGPEGLTEVTARYLIRGDGRRAPRKTIHTPFFACKTVYEIRRFDPEAVQLHFVAKGHVGFNPLSDSRMTMCLHVDGRYLKDSRGDLDSMMIGLAGQNRVLGELLNGATRMEDWKTCPAEPDNRRIFFEKDIFFIGDAVTMIHPIVGGGIPVAVGSGAILADLLLEGCVSHAAPAAIEKMYQRAWEKRYASRANIATWLGRAERSKPLSRAVFKAVGAVPVILPGIISRSRA